MKLKIALLSLITISGLNLYGGDRDDLVVPDGLETNLRDLDIAYAILKTDTFKHKILSHKQIVKMINIANHPDVIKENKGIDFKYRFKIVMLEYYRQLNIIKNI